MLQRTESGETSLTQVSSLAPSVSETLNAEAETLAGLDADLEEMAACTRARIKRNGRRAQVLRTLSLSYTLVAIAVSVAYLFVLITSTTTPAILMTGLMVLLVIVGPIVAFYGFKWLRKGATFDQELIAANKLLQREDVHVVAPLLDMAEWMLTTPLRPTFWQTLERLLPRMTEEEITQLGTRRHWLLAHWIQNWDLPVHRRKTFAGGGNPVLVQMLRVIATIGQGSIELRVGPASVSAPLMPTLNRWADGRGVGQDPKVRLAAILCREAIELKMARARTGAQLLRASSPPPVGSDTLLRPIQGASQTDPQELLRPGGKEA